MTDAARPADRPRRSVLYMPGSRQRALEKARDLAADALIFDLEDAVAPGEKALARRQVVATVKEGGYGHREIVIRINALDTPWGRADLSAAAEAGADAVLVPKVEHPQTLRRVAERLPYGGPRIWAMMETPLAMLNAAQIAAAHVPLDAFVLGTNDLINDLNAEHTPMRLPVITAIGLCLLAGRAHRLSVLDGVHNVLTDPEGFEQSCRQGKEFGMDGKTLIHPSQIEIANRIFAPSEDEVELARRQVEAFEEADAKGEGIAVVDGRIVESLHAASARRLLDRAEAIAARSDGG